MIVYRVRCVMIYYFNAPSILRVVEEKRKTHQIVYSLSVNL